MNKKGFTLIELLAVIIILAIVAIIATPIILNVIEESKESANLRSVEGYADAVKNKYFNDSLGGAKPVIDSEFLSNVETSGGEVNCEKVLYNEEHQTILYKCTVNNSEKKYCYSDGKHYDCGDAEFVSAFTGSGGTIEIVHTGSIGEVVLSNFPYLATNGNGCITSTGNNYSYMGGCYLRGGSLTGKEIFYSRMNQIGMDNDTITQTFFDSNGNFNNEAYDNYTMVENNYYTEQDLIEVGVDTTFELDFRMTSEELFAQQPLNGNSLWYSGFLWRIMGINADGTVRLITDENVTAIPWGAEDTAENWDESYARDWLNNYFYSRLKGNNIIKEEIWCNETFDAYIARKNCINNSSIEKSKVGLISLDEYYLSGGEYSYLNIEQRSWTITPVSSGSAYYFDADGSVDFHYSITDSNGLRAVVNVNSNVIITSGNGTLGATWSSQTGPYILNEDKNVEITGKLSEQASSGEYVLFAGKKYRVVDKDNNSNTKLISDGYYEEDGNTFEMVYGDDNVFSTTTGVGQKLNGDVLNWLTNNNDIEKAKLVNNYTWYQNNFDDGQSYTVSLNEENPTKSIDATVGLIRVGEMLSSQSSSILTNGYTTTNSFWNNTYWYWTLTPYPKNSNVWCIYSAGGANDYSNSFTYGLRPVIVIKSDVEITGGTGTFSNPYQI